MADNKVADPGSGGATFATDEIAGVDYPRVKVTWGVDGVATDASASNPLPVVQTGTHTVTGPLTDAQLRATPVPVSGTVTASGPLTDAELRASAVPVSLASVPSHAVTNAGTFVVQENGAALTALQLLDNIVKLEDDLHVTGDAGVPALAVIRAGGGALGGDGDYSPLTVDASGRLYVSPIPGQLGVEGGTGPATTLTQRVALANNVSIPAGTNNIGDVDVLTVPADPFGTNGDGASSTGSISAKLRTMAIQIESMIIDSSNNLRVQTQRPNSSNVTSVADSATSVQLLASTTSRQGATITNTSSATLYVKLGTTASLSSFTVPIVTGAYYEVPFGYTGRIDGIWASDPGDGAALITEVSP